MLTNANPSTATHSVSLCTGAIVGLRALRRAAMSPTTAHGGLTYTCTR